MELITIYDDGMNEYKNEITNELDENVLGDSLLSIKWGGGSYLYGDKEDGRLAIRFPGATRGGLSFNEEGIITDIMLYKDKPARSVQCYKEEVYELIKKYVGAKMIFK